MGGKTGRAVVGGHGVELRQRAVIGAHGLDLLAQILELRLPRQILETGAKLVGHAAHPADELANPAHQYRQVLGPDDDQRHRADDHELQQPVFRKHEGSARP
jgi:hypothetical protein